MPTPFDRIDNDEPCVVCGEWNYTRCDFCHDALCKEHAGQVPGHPILDACAHCLAARNSEPEDIEVAA